MESRLTMVIACLALVLTTHLQPSDACTKVTPGQGRQQTPGISLEVQCDNQDTVPSLTVNCRYTIPKIPDYNFPWSLFLFQGENLDQIEDITKLSDARRVAVKLVWMDQFNVYNNMSAQVSSNNRKEALDEQAPVAYIAYKWKNTVALEAGDHSFMCLAVVQNTASLVIQRQKVFATVNPNMMPEAKFKLMPFTRGRRAVARGGHLGW